MFKTIRMMRNSWFAVVAFAVLALVAASASASNPYWENLHQSFPGTACNQTGMAMNGTSLLTTNPGGGSLTCPIAAEGDTNNIAIDLAAIFATGPSNSVNCQIVWSPRNGSYLVWNPTNRLYFSGYDQIQFLNFTFTIGGMAAVACWPPNGSGISGYYVNSYYKDYLK